MKKALFVIQAIALALCLTCLVSITIFQPTVREYFRSTINNDLAKKLKPTVDVA